MATLIQLLAEYTTSTSLDFRNNENPASDGSIWAFAWVNDKEGKLLCIGASDITLKKLNDNPNMDNLVLSNPEQRVNPSKQIYRLCYLNIINTFDITAIRDKNAIEQPNNDEELEIKNNLLSENIELKNIISNLIFTSRNQEISEFISKNLIYENSSKGFKSRKDWFDGLESDFRIVLGLYNVKNYNELYDKLNSKVDLKIKSIENLNPIKYLFKVKYLKLTELHRSKIQPAYGNPIDLNPIRFLSNIETLEMSSFTVNDVSPLKYLYNLKKLKCTFLLSQDSGGYSLFSNFNSLFENTKLEKLEIINCGLLNIPHICNYNNITELNFAVNSINDISNLKYFENLETLNLSHNKNIKDFSSISVLHKLKNLNLSNTIISDFVEINLYHSYFKQDLKSLILSNTNFSCIENICKFTSLESLDLSENEITDLSPISNLLNLKKLSIRKMVGKIELAPIVGLKNLIELILDDNKTVDVDVLCKMRHLKKLNLLNCDLTLENENKLKSSLIDCDIQFRIVYPFY